MSEKLNACLLGILAVVLTTVSSKQSSYKNTDFKTTDYEKLDYSSEGKDEDSQVYVYPAGFKGGRYYYGGIYRGTCHNDGLYYRDEDSFVICSNGNAYVQPCAPGTRSSGQHRFSPGYYYGYSDFCDINLVDQGYGPAHYAPYGVPTYSSRSGQDTSYNNKKSTDYGSQGNYGAAGYNKDSYRDSYNSYSPSKNNLYTDKNSYGKDSYSPGSYSKGYSQQQYVARDLYNKKETAYEPNQKF